jgi:prepilin-type N-terminal cleavage/methylation domain-containing protein
MTRRAFTLIEVLVTVAIIGVLFGIAAVALAPVQRNARDNARKIQLDMIGRYILSTSCYAPTSGAGDYDLQQLFDDIVASKPEVAKFIPDVPRDPRSGTETVSGYRYAYEAGGSCALYANLENADAEVTLPALTAPTPGGGRGVLKAAAAGPNGSDKYYQTGK